MFGFIFGFIIGGFFGIFGMCLCVICRERSAEAKVKALLEVCEEYSKGVMLMRECKDEITLTAALQFKKAEYLGIAVIGEKNE